MNQTITQRKKAFSLRSKLIFMILLAAALSTAGILAYMTDNGSIDNLFTVGKVNFNLYESMWDGEQPDGSYSTPSNASPSDASPSNALGKDQAQSLYSGKVINKNPALKNNSLVDTYLHVKVTVPAASVVTADDDGFILNNGVPKETELFTFEENEGTGMKLISIDQAAAATASNAGGTSYIYTYAYMGDTDEEIPLPAGTDIPPLFDTVSFANVISGYIDQSVQLIRVDYEAIQSGGFQTPEEAWAAYRNQSR